MSKYESKQWSRRLRKAALTFACELCGAKPGEPCITSSGNNPITEHSLRLRRGRHKIDVEDGMVYTKKEAI